jgi:hypothetical protein
MIPPDGVAPPSHDGWGLVFSDVALSFVCEIAPEVYDSTTRGQAVFDDMEIVHPYRASGFEVRAWAFAEGGRLRGGRIPEDFRALIEREHG